MVFFCQVVGVFWILFITERKTNFLFVCLFYQLNKRTNKLSETLQVQLNIEDYMHVYKTHLSV